MYHVISALIKPYPLLLLFLGWGIFLLWRRGAGTKRLRLGVSLVYAILFAVSTPLFAHFALGALESQCPPTSEYAAGARAIVVLSGSMYVPTAAQPEPQLGESTLHRCLRAARIYFEDPTRVILVTGRAHRLGPSTASSMAQFLRSLGVPADHLLVEGESRNTAQSAVLAKPLLRDRNIHHVLLVSDASHMVRARRAFERTGLRVQAVGCRYRVAPLQWRLDVVLPSPSAAAVVQEVSHEVVGIVWYWARGRL